MDSAPEVDFKLVFETDAGGLHLRVFETAEALIATAERVGFKDLSIKPCPVPVYHHNKVLSLRKD